MTRLQLQNVSFSYPCGRMLHDISLHVRDGEFVGLIGPNGSGKSTLLKLIYRALRPECGEILLDGEDLLKMPFRKSALKMAVVGQENEIPFDFSVEEIVAMGRSPHKKLFDSDTEEDHRMVHHALEHLGIEDLAKRNYRHLSGGEKQRVLISRAIAQESDFLILDEPTNHLDIYTRENLTEALMAYTGTLLLVTHDRHLMNSLACPILYLEDGKATIYPSYDALMGRNAPAPAVQKAAEPAKIGYGKEQRRRRAELRAKIKACEDEMEACGAREVELDNEINSPEVYNDPDLLRQKSDELSDLRFHQEELFAAWEAAMEEQESYEQSQTEE